MSKYRPGAFSGKSNPEGTSNPAAEPPQSPVTPSSSSALPDAAHERIDPADGELYTEADFADCYGGLDEWHWAGLSATARELCDNIPDIRPSLSRYLSGTMKGDEFYSLLKTSSASVQAVLQAFKDSPGFDLYKYGILDGVHKRIGAKKAGLMGRLKDAVGEEALQHFRQVSVRGFMGSNEGGDEARVSSVDFLKEYLRVFKGSAEDLFDDIVSILPSHAKASSLRLAKKEYDLLKNSFSGCNLAQIFDMMLAVSDYILVPYPELLSMINEGNFECALELYNILIVHEGLHVKAKKGIVYSISEFAAVVHVDENVDKQSVAKLYSEPLFILINVDEFLGRLAEKTEGETQFDRDVCIAFCLLGEEGSARAFCSELISRCGAEGPSLVRSLLSSEELELITSLIPEVQKEKSRYLVTTLKGLGGDDTYAAFRSEAVRAYALLPADEVPSGADTFIQQFVAFYGKRAFSEDLLGAICATIPDQLKEKHLKISWRKLQNGELEVEEDEEEPEEEYHEEEEEEEAAAPTTMRDTLASFVQHCEGVDGESLLFSLEELCSALSAQDLPEVANHAMGVRSRLQQHICRLGEGERLRFKMDVSEALGAAIVAEHGNSEVSISAPVAVMAAFDAYDYLIAIDPSCDSEAIPDAALSAHARRDFLTHRFIVLTTQADVEKRFRAKIAKKTNTTSLASAGYDRLHNILDKRDNPIHESMASTFEALFAVFGEEEFIVELSSLFTAREERRVEKERRQITQRAAEEEKRIRKEQEDEAKEQARREKEEAAERLRQRREAEAREKKRQQEEAKAKERKLQEERAKKEAQRAEREREKEIERQRARREKEQQQREQAEQAEAPPKASTKSQSPPAVDNRKTRQLEAQKNRERASQQTKTPSPTASSSAPAATKRDTRRNNNPTTWNCMPSRFWETSPSCAACGETLGRKPCQNCKN